MQFLTNNILPITIALFSGLMLLWSLFGNRIRGIKEVDCPAALQLINHKNALILDVRDEAEYKAGNILHSISIPLSRLLERINDLDKERPIVVLCRSGNRSASASALLGKRGFTQVYNLTGGIIAWQKANLPLRK